MKKLLKRIPQKSLAVLLAVIMVLTSLTTMLIVSADPLTRYTVTTTDPVVPMTAGYSVNLADFDVDTGSGAVQASTLAWTVDAAVSADDLTITDGVISAFTRGTYKVTAGSMTLYIVVKAPNETEYVIWEADYRDTSNDNLADWTTVFMKGIDNTVLGRIAGADNTVSSQKMDTSEAATTYNPIAYWNYHDRAAGSEVEYTRLKALNIPSGFVPYNPNTLIWFDPTDLLAQRALVDAGSATSYKTTDGINNYFALSTNHPEVTDPERTASVKPSTAQVAFQYGHPMKALTVLNNDTIAAFQNYKVTAGVRMRTGYYGNIGIAGRISSDGDTFDYKNNADNLSTVALSSSSSYGAQGAVVYSSDATSSTFGAANVKVITTTGQQKKLYSMNFASATHTGANDMSRSTFRTYEYDFNGSSLTVSSPDISTVGADDGSLTLTSTANPGYIGFVTTVNFKDYMNPDPATKYAWYTPPVPIIYDVKVTLNESVDPTLLPTTKMGGVTAAEKVFGTENYVDNHNYKIGLQYGYMGLHSKINDLDADYTNYLDYSIGYQYDAVNDTYEATARTVSVVNYRILTSDGANPKTNTYLMYNDVSQVKISKQAYSIQYNAFSFGHFIEKIDGLDGHLENVGTHILSGAGIREAVFSDNLVVLDNGAFYTCDSLTKVDLGKRLTKIGNETFYNCTMLKEIKIPASLTTLGTNSFYGCNNLAKVYVYNPDLNVVNGTGLPQTATIYTKAGSTCATTAQNAGYTVVDITAEVDAAVDAYAKQEEQFTTVKVPKNAVIDLTGLQVKAAKPALYADIAGVIVNDDVTYTNITNDANLNVENNVLTTGGTAATGLTVAGVYSGDLDGEPRAVTLNVEIVDEADTNLLAGQYTILTQEQLNLAEQNAGTIKIPVNQKTDVSKFTVNNVNGANIDWAATSNDYFAFDGENFVTFAAGTANIVSADSATTLPITVVATEAEGNVNADQVADISTAAITLAPAGSANMYTVTFDASNGTLIPNSVKFNGNVVYAPADTTGTAFNFTTATLANLSITAEFTTEDITDQVYFMGSTVRTEMSGSPAIAFVNRLPAITYSAGTTSHSTVPVDSEDAEVLAIGTLMIPSVLLGEATLAIPTDQVATFDPATTTQITLGAGSGQVAINILHRGVTTTTAKFADVTAILNGLSNAQKQALDISAVTYIQYQKANDTIGYIYGTVNEKNYAEVLAALS